MKLDYYLDQTQREYPPNSGNRPPRICPACHEHGTMRKMKEPDGYEWFECFNTVKTYLGSASADGRQLCSYKWDWPKNRE